MDGIGDWLHHPLDYGLINILIYFYDIYFFKYYLSKIRKSVTIEIYETAMIRDVTYVLEELDDTWRVNVTVHLESGVQVKNPRTLKGTITVDLINVLEQPITKQICVTQNYKGELSISDISFEVKKVNNLKFNEFFF